MKFIYKWNDFLFDLTAIAIPTMLFIVIWGLFGIGLCFLYTTIKLLIEL